MVKLTKSPLPDGIVINSADVYRSGIAFETLINDCHQKCYICEDKPTSINVEHIVAHKSDPALKFDWDNLFIACWHCNNIKSTKYDDIINPVLINPEECIALSVRISDNFIEAVQVIPLKTDAQALKTAELLEIVYNGGSTAMKKVESANLRNEHLLPDIKLFLKYISDYIDEPDLGYDSIIRQEISCSAKFAAFKRRIIAEDTELSVAFADALA